MYLVPFKTIEAKCIAKVKANANARCAWAPRWGTLLLRAYSYLCCHFGRARAQSREQEQRARAESTKKNAIFFYVTVLYFLSSIHLFVTISMYFTAIFLKFSYIIKQRK